ncbi:MAG: DUF447 family protein, partial [Asgard group archaeon]|nr:DUF447 family protein [Asgard group archaeon]
VCTLFQKELKKNDFYPLEASTIPALKEAKNNCLVIQKEAITNSQRINQKIITCDIQEKYFKSQFMPLYTRAFSSLLEILIHSTRIIAYSHQPSENQKRINYLLHQMKYHTTIIHKVTNKVSNYHKLLRKIENKLKEETQKSFLS